MAKKVGMDFINNRKPNANLDLSKVSENTKNVIDEIKSIANPTKEMIVNAVEVIKNDNEIEDEFKISLIEQLRNDYFTLFNPNNCPEDYESLKNEAKFLAGMTQYSFLLMAQRLKVIRDKELYKEDGYDDFKAFIEKEINVSRSSAYNYIDIVEFFGVQPVGHQEKIEYAKLLPAIPLLRANNNNIPKEEIKKKLLEEISTKSKREIIEQINGLKIKYGLSKQKSKNGKLPKMIDAFEKNIPEEISDYDKILLTRFIERMKKYI